MKLRNKIFLYYGTYTLSYILILLLINTTIIQRSLIQSAQHDLKTQIESVYSATKSLIETAIANYLRSIVDMNLEYLDRLNERVERGDLTLDDAKDLYQEYAKSRQIGDSGYIMALQEREDGIFMEIHPYLRGVDVSSTSAYQNRRDNVIGFGSYDWQNPQDKSSKKKVAYMEYFEPWDWNLGATTYEEELYQLISVEDLRGIINSFKIKERGYFFLMDSHFIMRIHPHLEGENVYDLQGPDNSFITHEMLKNMGDFYYYLWTDPVTGRDEEKYALAMIIEPFGWYVVASGYVSEIMNPVSKLLRMGYILSVMMGLSLIILTLWFTRSLTRPMNHMVMGLHQFYSYHTLYRKKFRSVSEIESVGTAVEKMTSSILDYEKTRSDLTVQLNSIINSMPSIIIGVDRQKNVIFLNDKAIQYTNVSKMKALNRPVMELLKDFENAQSVIERGLESGTVTSDNIVLNIPTASGDRTYYEITVYPLDKQKEHSVIRMDDVTERTQMEEMLLHSRKMEAIGQLAGGVAHDFNNMLTAILHSLEYLEKMTEKNSDAELYLKNIEEASMRAADLTQKLLTFSRKANKVFSPQNVQLLLQQTIEILKHSLNKNIVIAEDYQAEENGVMGDLAQLQSLFMNLGINAAQAMPEGGALSFRTWNTSFPEDRILSDGNTLKAGTYLIIDVSDTGGGIPEEIRDKIFDPFFTTKGIGQGTGLGLPSVLGVVKQHKGNISLQSRVGHGTTFTIELPVLTD